MSKSRSTDSDFDDESAKEVSESEQTKKEKQFEEARQNILSNVAAYSVNTIRDRVAWLLNRYPDTRDSDISLQIKYWEAFEENLFNGHSIAVSDYDKLTRLTTIARTRAKLQNEYKLFLASTEVRQMRGTLSEEEKEKAVADKPSYPVFTVYMDDSGKNADYMIIGSIWFLSDYRSIFRAIHDLRERTGFKKEFHFKEMSREDWSIYKAVVDIFCDNTNAVSFKLISVPRSRISREQDVFTALYYHLLVRGIEHEDTTRRAPLPRTLQVWIDTEEEGADKLRIANLKDKLKQASVFLFDGKLTVDQIYTVDSRKNSVLQIADLFTGSANRRLNRPGASRNHKDELSEYFLNRIGIDPQLSEIEEVGDMAVHISL